MRVRQEEDLTLREGGREKPYNGRALTGRLQSIDYLRKE